MALLLGAWQGAVAIGAARALVVSTPVRVGLEFLAIVSDPDSWRAVAVTAAELGGGLAVGGAAGILAGSLFARVALLDRMMKPLVLALYTLPRLALLPLLVVWLGLGSGSKVAVAILHGFVLFMLGAYSAVSGIDRRMVEACRMFGAGPLRRLTLVFLPASLPYLATTLRQALGLALGSVIVAEISGSYAGVGFEIGLRLGRFDMTGVIAWVVLVALLALALDRLALALERRLGHGPILASGTARPGSRVG